MLKRSIFDPCTRLATLCIMLLLTCAALLISADVAVAHEIRLSVAVMRGGRANPGARLGGCRTFRVGRGKMVLD